MTNLTPAQRRVLATVADGFLRRVWVEDRRRHRAFEVLVRRGYVKAEFATGYSTDYRITPTGRAALIAEHGEGGE